MPEPMRIAHLTDLHVTEGPDLDDQAVYLRKITTDLLAARPHLVLLTGDYYGHTVPHKPSPRERAVLEPFLVEWADICPVAVLEGNHDHGEALGLVRLLGGALPIRVVQSAERFEVFTTAGPVTIYALPYPTKRHLVAHLGAVGAQESGAVLAEMVQTILKGWAARMERERRKNPNARIVCAMHTTITGSSFGGTEVHHSQEVEIPQGLLLGMDVDYGALGHIHQRQQLAPGWWYAGNPWPVDFGERDDKGWHLVEIGAHAEGARVTFMPTGARRWITLEYRWATDEGTGAGRWMHLPALADLAAIPGNVVRMRLSVPDHAVAGCPWDEEVARIEAMQPHRLKIIKSIEPTQRVRAPELMAGTTTLAQKMQAVWSTQATPPGEREQKETLDVLHELETMPDEVLEAQIGKLISSIGL